MSVDAKRLRELAEAATPGPWGTMPVRDHEDWPSCIAIAATAGRQKVYACPPGGTYPLADQQFIAAANPQTVIALLDEIERLRRDRDSYANSDFERQLDEARSQLSAMTAARDEACEIAERRGAAIDYLERKIDGYETTFDVADEIEHGLVDKQGCAEIEGAERLPSTTLRIAELRKVGQ